MLEVVQPHTQGVLTAQGTRVAKGRQMGAVATEPDRQAPLSSSVEAASRRLLDLQHEDGHWCAELEGDTILESEYLLLLHFLGRLDEDRARKAANYIRARQDPDGAWAIHPGGPADVSASVKAYFVLKLLGDDPEAPHMKSARRLVRDLGGVEACNSFTKIYLSIFGQYEWRKSPSVPPELILLPNWWPFNIYEMSSWSRAIVVPLSIISARKPICPVPEEARIDELHVEGATTGAWGSAEGVMGRVWADIFRIMDRGHKIVESLGLVPFRRRAIRKAEGWILERLEMSDGLGAIFPPIVNTIIALRAIGYAPDHPTILEQSKELEKLEIEEDDTLRLEPCKSPVWDTALCVNALPEAIPADDASLARAAGWLADKEVRRPGDWRVKNPDGPVGGWYFEYANEFYPDCDDTAQILTALSKLEIADPAERRRVDAVMDRAKAWLLSMQNRDGGWASFDKDCDHEYLTYIPFADHNAMIDPSTTDITSRVLEALALLGHDMDAPEVRRGVEFVLRDQEPDGSWHGRWGCNYLYGTGLALWGLRRAGEDPSASWARQGAAWIRSCQNPDGGWGESLESYEDPAYKGQGPSTAAQTAWAMMGLLAAGETEEAALRRGAEFLIRTQLEHGGWKDEAWTGTGFPKVFYLRYHLYATYFPLLALACYRRREEWAVELAAGPQPVRAAAEETTR